MEKRRRLGSDCDEGMCPRHRAEFRDAEPGQVCRARPPHRARPQKLAPAASGRRPNLNLASPEIWTEDPLWTSGPSFPQSWSPAWAKVKYKVRFDKAEQRIKSLSQDLSHAYDKIATLLGDRLRAEDAKARNDALVSYLGTIRSADLENEFNFLPNREEVLQLLHCHKRSNANFDTLDALEAEVANKIQLSRHIEGHCKEMLRLVAGMQGMWNTVPTALRESVFVRGRGGSVDVHPVSAMVQISEALKIVMDMLQEHKAKMMIVIQHQTEEASPVSSRKIRLP